MPIGNTNGCGAEASCGMIDQPQSPHQQGRSMPLAYQTIVGISLELDPKNYSMRTPAGFKKNMQFEMEVLKEHDAPGGAGQIVRGVHMRLHAGSHIDAREHNVGGDTSRRSAELHIVISGRAESANPESRDIRYPGQFWVSGPPCGVPE